MAQKKSIPAKRMAQIVSTPSKKSGYGWMWWLVPGALVGAGVYFTFFRKTVPIEDVEQHNNQTVTANTQAGTPSVSTAFPLKNGDFNSSLVQKLQQALNVVLTGKYRTVARFSGIAKLNDDGDFGSLTEAALFAVTGTTTIDEATYRSFVADPTGWAESNFVRLRYNLPI